MTGIIGNGPGHRQHSRLLTNRCRLVLRLHRGGRRHRTRRGLAQQLAGDDDAGRKAADVAIVTISTIGSSSDRPACSRRWRAR